MPADPDEPILHVGARAPEGFLSANHNASFDHMAFRMTGATEFREHVRKLGIKFEEQNVPEAGYQIFLMKPDGSDVRLLAATNRRTGRSQSSL